MPFLIFFGVGITGFIVYVIVCEMIRHNKSKLSIEIRQDGRSHVWRVRQFDKTVAGEGREFTHEQAMKKAGEARDRVAAVQAQKTEWEKVS